VSAVRVRHFTDPGSAEAFAAEPLRLRLRRLYGDRLTWELHMIGLAEERGDGWRHATIHACRAVVAAGLRWPDRQQALLERLRALAMAGELLDDSDTLEIAAEQAGLPVAEIAAYCAEPEVEAALRADMEAARSVSYGLVRDDGGARLDLPGRNPAAEYEAALADLARVLRD
jgi:predicted DsbA family dithiol-disulfide isomerase